MMNRFIIASYESVHGAGTEESSTVVFGAKECTDVPLEPLVRRGFVCLVDVDEMSLRLAREKLSEPSLRDRVAIASMDASLFENTLIDRARRLLRLHREHIDRAFLSVLAMNRQAGEADSALFVDTRLPIEQNAVDFVVSSMTLSQFMIGYIQVLVKMFLHHYGRERTREYFLSVSGTYVGSAEHQRVEELQRSTTALAQRATSKHLRELGRIVKPEGVVVLSDHALVGRCVRINQHEVEVEVPSLIPYSKNLDEDKVLRFREDQKRPMPTVLRVDRTQPDTLFAIQGRDALKSILEQDGGLKIMHEQGWWWVTERDKSADKSSPVWNLSYVEAFALTRREGEKA